MIEVNRFEAILPHLSATPLAQTFPTALVILASDYDAVVKERDAYKDALKALSERHDWMPAMGQCICHEHKVAHEALKEKA